jgi:hypothetical protein
VWSPLGGEALVGGLAKRWGSVLNGTEAGDLLEGVGRELKVVKCLELVG